MHAAHIRSVGPFTRLMLLAAASLAVLFGSDLARAQSTNDPEAKPGAPEAGAVVIVAPCEAEKPGLRNYAGSCRTLLEDMLVNKRTVRVVERQKLDAILREQNFSRNSSLADPETAVKAGKAVGATVIVLGTVVDLESEKRTDNSYGTRTATTTTTATFRVRVIDVETGTQVFSRIVEASETLETNSQGGSSKRDPGSAVFKKAIDKLNQDGQYMTAVGAVKRKPSRGDEGMVTVAFEPAPSGCDVLIDGEFKGTTPLKLKLQAKTAVQVVIRKAGYAPWEAKIVPTAELPAIKPELAKSSKAAE